MGEPLTDEQIAEEEKFLAGLPRVNLGALFLAPVWGPAHGMWAAFLFFVAWLFADNVIYAATVEPTAMNVVLAILMARGAGGRNRGVRHRGAAFRGASGREPWG